MACLKHKAKQIVKALSEKDVRFSIVEELTKPEKGMILANKTMRKISNILLLILSGEPFIMPWQAINIELKYF